MTTSDSGLLIVNADDLGMSREATDAILDSFQAGTVSSATALVWMADSDRAGQLAWEKDLPLGLHLNLIEPFTAADVPERVAATQLRIIERLRRAGPHAYLYHPAWSRDFERCIADQLARFVEVYGRPPTHVDGHRHWQLVPNALFARSLAPVRRCRKPVNRPRDESRPYKHLGRAILSGLVRVRFSTTDWCFSIRGLDPSLGGSGLEQQLSLATTDSVEVMVHPSWDDERAALLAPEWHSHLNRFRVGSFADLPKARRRRMSIA